MTDNEIIKALEICLDETIEDGHCKSCPCKDACYGEEGIHALEKAALDLIKRQQERIDRIVEQLENAKEKCSQAHNAAIFTCTRFEYKGATSGLAHAIAIVKGVQNE